MDSEERRGLKKGKPENLDTAIRNYSFFVPIFNFGGKGENINTFTELEISLGGSFIKGVVPKYEMRRLRGDDIHI